MFRSRYLKYVLPLLLFLFACGKKEKQEVKIPEGVLSEEAFTKVLTDFALAESAASMNVKALDYKLSDSVYAFNPLLENHISKGKYDSSLVFYAKQPELYKKIYENVLTALSEMQARRNPFIKDSAAR